MENGEIEGADDALPVPAPPNGRRYRPVGSNDRAVIQMTSTDPGSSSASAADAVTPQPPRNLKPGANLTVDPSMQEGSDDHATSSGSQRDSKLELFGFDSLVNILGLKSMTGEQIQAPSSPRDAVDSWTRSLSLNFVISSKDRVSSWTTKEKCCRVEDAIIGASKGPTWSETTLDKPIFIPLLERRYLKVYLTLRFLPIQT